MSQTNIMTIVYAVVFVACLVLEHFNILPVGAEQGVLLLITGHAVGTLTSTSPSPIVNTVSNTTSISDPGING